MGGVVVLHPHDVLTDRRDNLFSTPVKSRRTSKTNPNFSNSNPNFTRSEARKRSPPTGLRKNKSTATIATDPPKNLVMGQVKILKRGEPLDDLTDRKVSNAKATTTPSPPPPPTNYVVGDRKVGKDSRRIAPATKKSDNEKTTLSNPKIDDFKIDDFALSSTDRIGPDPDMVPKQINKSFAEFFFAGSAFVESPPPSSVPLPGFFTKSYVGPEKDDPTTDLRRMLGLDLS